VPGTLFVAFDNVSQTSTPDPDWANLTNILVDDGAYTIANVTASPQNTETEFISLDGDNLSSLVPVGAVIERLILRHQAYYTKTGGSGTSGVFVSINNGTSFGGSVGEGPPGSVTTEDKTLAEWGLTQQQARDFIDGLLEAQCWGEKFNDTSDTIDIDYVLVSAVYATDFTNLPTVF
jgi:hypothetical protein